MSNNKNTGLQVLASLVASITIYALIIFLSLSFFKVITIIVDFVILSGGVFAGIKLIRKKYTAAGAVLLAALVPLIFVTLVFGGCFVMFASNNQF